MKEFVDQRLTEQYKRHNKAMTPKQFLTGSILVLAFAYFAFAQPESFISFYFLIGASLFLFSIIIRYIRNLAVLDRIAVEAHKNELHWDDDSQRFRYNHHAMFVVN
jgi:hypothetical protein